MTDASREHQAGDAVAALDAALDAELDKTGLDNAGLDTTALDTTPGSDVDPVVRLATVSDQPLDVGLHEAAVDHPRSGARVVFCGVVREFDRGRRVVELEYQGHPSAEQVITEVAREIAAEPGVHAVAVSHRVGTLVVGDTALVAAVATAHRRDAFALCGRLVEEVKARLPIWKRQVFDDGTDEWVNFP